jgi:hypothetical protein
LWADGRPTSLSLFSSRKKRMPSPITYPSGLQATNCFALPGWKPSNEFTPNEDSNLNTSGPSMVRSVMW